MATYRIQIYANETTILNEYLKDFEEDRYRSENENAILFIYNLYLLNTDAYCIALWKRTSKIPPFSKLICKFYPL